MTPAELWVRWRLTTASISGINHFQVSDCGDSCLASFALFLLSTIDPRLAPRRWVTGADRRDAPGQNPCAPGAPPQPPTTRPATARMASFVIKVRLCVDIDRRRGGTKPTVPAGIIITNSRIGKERTGPARGLVPLQEVCDRPEQFVYKKRRTPGNCLSRSEGVRALKSMAVSGGVRAKARHANSAGKSTIGRGTPPSGVSDQGIADRLS